MEVICSFREITVLNTDVTLAQNDVKVLSDSVCKSQKLQSDNQNAADSRFYMNALTTLKSYCEVDKKPDMATETGGFVATTKTDNFCGPINRSLQARNKSQKLQHNFGKEFQSEVKDSVHLVVNNLSVDEDVGESQQDHSENISSIKDQNCSKNLVCSDEEKKNIVSNTRFEYCEGEVCKASISLESPSDYASHICSDNLVVSCKNRGPASHVTALAVDLPLTNLGIASTEIVLIFH